MQNSETQISTLDDTMITNPKKRRNLSFLVGFILRMMMIVYSVWHDRNFMVKYTDVDYQVFTDAAEFVVNGESPFKRGTYRYTPLLSYLMIPNILIHPIMGKLLFCLVDLLVAWLVYELLQMNFNRFYQKENPCNNISLILTNATVLLNPILVNVSTRGNADQCIVLLVLLSLYSFQKRQLFQSSIWFGLSVHFKIYPIIYLPTILIYIYFFMDFTTFSQKTKACFWYCVWSGGTCLTLLILFYQFYGYQFLYESYLYHVVRSDNRHNFSIYFYYLYLDGALKSSKIISLLAFLPQFLSLLALSWNTTRRNFFCTIFSQTFIFVMFNKVCTVQYFVWFISIFGFTLQSYFYDKMKNATTRFSLLIVLIWIALWFIGQGVWLSTAYRLEFLGENTFRDIWMSSVLFFIINTGIAIYFRPL
ncbi:hypothetical protein FDP41_003017 [Naegleria fowleri]|uniref:GPI mannosyltransferase 1 n=1 Tax=Naegleria fowleri TaxID=5763 RepID=A0A6A5BWK9_NAEFO|nr:uncharacterized protein FDP41_003017 [Naegleria fowleri]KAF0977695.1 hypothetical protein FDP41_003017 [Naegleria fowleri]CAG4715093.1 unnamed protein product [Naegleria fowleri]